MNQYKKINILARKGIIEKLKEDIMLDPPTRKKDRARILALLAEIDRLREGISMLEKAVPNHVLG
jgi:hypothetical protein